MINSKEIEDLALQMAVDWYQHTYQIYNIETIKQLVDDPEVLSIKNLLVEFHKKYQQANWMGILKK